MKPVIPILLLAAVAASACHATSSGEGSRPRAPSDGDRPPSDGDRPPAATPVPVATLASDTQSGVVDEARMVLRTAESWRAFWARHNANRLPQPPLPEVDFARDMVVVVSLGARPSAGFGVTVDRAEDVGGFLRVHARESAPPKGSAQAAVMTYPIQVVRVPRYSGPVDIRVE